MQSTVRSKPVCVPQEVRRHPPNRNQFGIDTVGGPYCRHETELFDAALRLIQLGFAVEGAAEAAVHADRSFLESNSNSALPKAFVQLDVKNAFNSLDTMLNVVVAKALQVCPSSTSVTAAARSCSRDRTLSSHRKEFSRATLLALYYTACLRMTCPAA